MSETTVAENAPPTVMDSAPNSPGALATLPSQPPARFTVSHVADFYRRFPGEPLTFLTRVDVLESLPDLTVQISLPNEVEPGEYRASESHGGNIPDLAVAGDGRYLVWRVDRAVRAGERFEYEVRVTVGQIETDLTLESTALIVSETDAGRVQESASVEVAVDSKSRYLKYLPAIYYDDELMGRFLMIFESMWGPIEKQIDTLFYYLDPKMTPPALLPWLASWSDLALDERWPEANRRKLVSAAARLYRMRGTVQGLIEYLEIYTGRKAIITEHRANNLRLGSEAKLGPSIALGRSNRPHSFTVYLLLPPAPLAEGEDESIRARREQDRRRTIESIIESEKPAHTTYNLAIEILSEGKG